MEQNERIAGLSKSAIHELSLRYVTDPQFCLLYSWSKWLNSFYLNLFLLQCRNLSRSAVFDGPQGYGCTTGNGILSRFPLAAPQTHYCAAQCCFFPNRAGGRSAAVADVMVLPSFTLRVYSTHLESGTSLHDQAQASAVRVNQIHELVLDALLRVPPQLPVVLAGDFNAVLQDNDPVLLEALDAQYKDAHATLPWLRRGTCAYDIGLRVYLTCDYVLYRGGNYLIGRIGGV